MTTGTMNFKRMCRHVHLSWEECKRCESGQAGIWERLYWWIRDNVFG